MMYTGPLLNNNTSKDYKFSKCDYYVVFLWMYGCTVKPVWNSQAFFSLAMSTQCKIISEITSNNNGDQFSLLTQTFCFKICASSNKRVCLTHYLTLYPFTKWPNQEPLTPPREISHGLKKTKNNYNKIQHKCSKQNLVRAILQKLKYD